jgi:hypothetical protein
MSRSIRKSLITLLILLLVGLGLRWWYQNLPLRKKQFIQNLIRQVPDLPARYMV